MENNTSKPKTLFRIFLTLILLVVTLSGYGIGYYYYQRNKKTEIILQNPEKTSQSEVKEIIDKLSKIYAVPEGEDPSIATVLDKEKLKDQPFFTKAENGDKVIIYTKSQLAILYRLNENKIISIAPVTLQPSQSPEEIKPTQEANPQPKDKE